jgi:glycine/D-amino acid oxidase-like deaminating enzyme
MDRSPDLVVIGAGVMGAWTAYWARRSGLATVLVDAWGAGNPRATSSDETRISRSSHGDDRFYPLWSRRARELWITLGEAWGQELFVQSGALWFAHREDGFEAASIATLTDLGIPIERVGLDEARRRWPQVDVDDLAFLAFEPEAGFLMSRRGVLAAVDAFRREGGQIITAAVRPGRIDGDRLADIVAADGARIAAERFVFAAGPWLPTLFPELLGALITVTRQDVLFVGPAPGDDRFGPDRLPAWVDYDGAYYGVPGADGRAPKIAADGYGPVFEPTGGERLVDPASVDRARDFLADRFPGLAAGPVVETRVCQYETTPDTHFIIDRHTGLENAWIVGGGSGHGFKHGPRIGEYVVERLLGAPVGPGEERFSLTHPRGAPVGLRSGASASGYPLTGSGPSGTSMRTRPPSMTTG